MAAHLLDKFLVSAGLGLAVGSTAFFGPEAWRGARSRGGVTLGPSRAEGVYPSSADAMPPMTLAAWMPPRAQSRGHDWIYEVFTPPEIFYHARSNEFTVHPPAVLLDAEPTEPFGVQIISIRREAFRLRLIGYVGREGEWRGTFENVLSGDVFLAAAGYALPQHGVDITSVEVRRQPVEVGEGAGASHRVAASILREIGSGRIVTLTEGETGIAGSVVAIIHVAGESDAREVRTGDRFQVGDASYAIEDIKDSPASLTIIRESPQQAAPERRVLLGQKTDLPVGEGIP